jgi:Short C-terminal domain
MLFLLRPQQTWMPYAFPRDPVQQEVRNEQMRSAYDSTRRVPVSRPGESASSSDLIANLKALAELRDSGALSAEEFAAAKERLLSGSAGT